MQRICFEAYSPLIVPPETKRFCCRVCRRITIDKQISSIDIFTFLLILLSPLSVDFNLSHAEHSLSVSHCINLVPSQLLGVSRKKVDFGIFYSVEMSLL